MPNSLIEFSDLSQDVQNKKQRYWSSSFRRKLLYKLSPEFKGFHESKMFFV